MIQSMPPAARRLLVSFAMAAALASPTAWSAEKGDANAGANKAAPCIACHGMNGNSITAQWPVLAGQNANYVREQVQRIKANHRPVPEMLPMVQNLSAQDIADLAAYYAVQTPTGNEADPSYWKDGEKLYRGGDPARGIPACGSCHGPLGRGNPAAGYPALQAQHALYTMKQLDNYAADTRYVKNPAGEVQAGPNASMMKTIATRLTPEDRRNLASYIQGLR